jgi:hypothetical protein
MYERKESFLIAFRFIEKLKSSERFEKMDSRIEIMVDPFMTPEYTIKNPVIHF